MKTITTRLALPPFIHVLGLWLAIAWPVCLHAGELVLPAKDDPRTAQLDSVNFEALKFDQVSMEEFCNQVQLSGKLRCSLILRDEVKDIRFSLQYPGGSLRSLLQQVTSSAPITIRFEPLSVAIESDKGSNK